MQHARQAGVKNGRSERGLENLDLTTEAKQLVPKGSARASKSHRPH